MSSESQKSVSYVMTKSVSTHMEDDVLKLPSFTPTQQAVTELQRYERDDIIVTDASGKAIGIVTDQDILNKVSDKNVYAETTILEDIMSSPLITVTPGTQIQNALRIMRDRNVRKWKGHFRKSWNFQLIVPAVVATILNDTVTATGIYLRLHTGFFLMPPKHASVYTCILPV